MECCECREALSARLDGERAPVSEAAVRRHLDECGECRAWEGRAAELSRVLRVRAVPATPDVSASVLATLPEPRPRVWPRVLLGVVAAVQILLGAAQLIGTGGHDAMAGHVFHESGAWNLALGAGLAWTAGRTRAGAGMLPVLGAFVGVLAVVSIGDLIHGVVSAGRLLTHLPLVAALALLLVVRHDRLDHHPSPGHGVGPERNAVRGDEPDEPGPRELGPTAHRRAS